MPQQPRRGGPATGGAPAPGGAPVPIARRALLGGTLGGTVGAAAALGIASLALPAASAAASQLGPLLADGDVAGAFRRTGDVAGTATTYLILTHTGAVGEDSVYELELTSALTGVDGVVVAGGGAGGGGRGAGGGAGGVARPDAGATLAAGTYRVTVGGGGVAVRVGSSSTTGEWARGGSGRDSGIVAVAGGTALTGATATGGGGGGAEWTGRTNGADGGSGGGAGGYGTADGTTYTGGTGTTGQGSDGADSGGTRAGGGGGATGAGGTANLRRSRLTGNTAPRSADGGDGLDLTAWCEAARSLGGPAVGELDDVAGTFHLAGGGAGFDSTTGNVSACGLPGLGGGRGGYAVPLKDLANETTQDGLDHTGGGGGGLQRFYVGGADGIDGGASGGRAGHGGSGVVLLRWPTDGNVMPTVRRVG